MTDDLIRKLASGISERHIEKYAKFAAEQDALTAGGKTVAPDGENASDGLKTPFSGAGDNVFASGKAKRGVFAVSGKRSSAFGTVLKAAASIVLVLMLVLAGFLLGQYFRSRSDPYVTVPPLMSPDNTSGPTSFIDDGPTELPSSTEIPDPTGTPPLITPDTSAASPTLTADTSTAVSLTPSSPSTSMIILNPSPAASVSASPSPSSTPDPTPRITDSPATSTAFAPASAPATTAVPVSVALTEDNFPDRAFREYIANEYDLNKDSILSYNELRRITFLTIVYDHKSFKGIEYFFALDSLYFIGPDFKILDLSSVPDITDLCVYCSSDPAFTETLEELDISQNHKLKTITIYSNLISGLDLSGNPELTGIDLHIPSLSGLDLSFNTKLDSLALEGMTLPELDLSNNNLLTTCHMINSGVDELDMKNNDVIDYLLYVGGSRLDISGCEKLKNAYLYGTCSDYLLDQTGEFIPMYEYLDQEIAGTIITDCAEIYVG